VATIDQGQVKWERKTSGAGAKWKAAVGDTGRWAEGLRRAGAQPGPISTQAYSAGVGAVTAADFDASVSGKGPKWRENFLRGISR
jgi:hypothetical protein